MLTLGGGKVKPMDTRLLTLVIGYIAPDRACAHTGVARSEAVARGGSLRVTEKDLEEIVGAIRSVADPAAIILFGSQARGEANEDSDVDLLVVRRDEFQEGESRGQELTNLYRAVTERCRIPKDILLFTEAEVTDWRGTLNHPIARALREGRVLYGQV